MFIDNRALQVSRKPNFIINGIDLKNDIKTHPHLLYEGRLMYDILIILLRRVVDGDSKFIYHITSLHDVTGSSSISSASVSGELQLDSTLSTIGHVYYWTEGVNLLTTILMYFI